MRTLTLGTLQLIGSGTPTYNINMPVYLIESIEGLDNPDRRVNSYDLPGEDGGNVGSNFYGMRTVTITGWVRGGDVASHEAARRTLASTCRLQRDEFGVPQKVRVYYTAMDGQSYFLDGVVKDFKCPRMNNLTASFIVSIIAPDPMAYGITALSSGLISRSSGGGVVVPAIFPVTLEGSSGGAANFYNGGTDDTWPVITFSGALTNPFIYSQERNVQFNLNYVMGSNDVVVIDMKQKTVVLNGSSSLLGSKTADSDWFSLPPGNNTITFSTASSSDTGTMKVEAYPAYTEV